MQTGTVVLGGTFDRLHAGHYIHLKHAFELGRPLVIGLTTAAMIGHKELSELIEPYELRKDALDKYISEKWPAATYLIVPITDMYGPTLERNEMDTIVVTSDTHKGGLKVNEERVKLGLKELDIVVAPLLPAADGGALCSSRIRLGQIDRQGFAYRALFDHTLQILQDRRDALRQPVGMTTGRSADFTASADKAIELIHGHTPTLIISVGDIVTKSLMDRGLHPNIILIDLKSDAKEIEGIARPDRYDMSNPAGTIQRDSVEILERHITDAMKKMSSKVLLVDGEEDLLALPAILLAPLDAVVLYGQKDHGIVLNFVSEKLKAVVRDIILSILAV